MQIFVEDLDGRTRTLDVDHETTAADICGGGGKLLHNGSIVTGSLRDANVQKDATLHVVECLRGGVEREYNSSDEDSVTTDSNGARRRRGLVRLLEQRRRDDAAAGDDAGKRPGDDPVHARLVGAARKVQVVLQFAVCSLSIRSRASSEVVSTR